MPHDRCIVGYCDNDKRYPERMIVHSNAKDGKIIFQEHPLNIERQKSWLDTVSKGRDFEKKNILKCVQVISLRKRQLNEIQIQLYFQRWPNILPTRTRPRCPHKKRCVSLSLGNNNESLLQLFVDSTPIVPNNICRTFVFDDPKQALSSRKSIEMRELLLEENKTNQTLYDNIVI